MKHARLRPMLVRTLLLFGAATAIITVPACNSPRRLETSGGPMVESARAVKKEEPKKTEITLPINIEKKIPEAKDVEGIITVIDKDGKERKLKKALKPEIEKEERVKPTTFK